ncbi:MAG: PTS sugar transporter [Candidatus Aureabacteria bacterium]|nr:PTS sugar transporter [Candidatus Auribacterota bacterium]MCK5161214.1 PTS sugar transporter [Candidatus Auribacterota bacterium]
MIGVVVAAHGNLARDLVSAAEEIVGKIEKLAVVSQLNKDKHEDIERNLTEAIESVDSPDGVLVLVDIFGGSPANIGMSILKKKKIKIVTGVNLPMLMEFAVHRNEKDLKKLALQITRTGRRSVFTAESYLKKRKIEIIDV